MPRPDGGAIRQIRMLFNLGRIADLTDGQLLERYLSREGERSELAFAALVERHGPMVLRTCRAVLRDEHDARDAFQATFQVLARKARSLRVRDSLGPWLHQVALRTAKCARSRSHRRKQAEAVAAEGASEAKRSADPADRIELAEVLHLELDRLPDRYRSPVVLCCLEGLSLDQAARRLGWPLGTVQSRLARGRQRLRDRLVRRGIAPSIGSFGALLAAEQAGASVVPVALADAAVLAASHLASGTPAAGAVPAAVLALTEGVLRTMFLTKLKIGAAAIAVVVVGGGSWAGAPLLAVGPVGGNPAHPAAPPAVALSRTDDPEPPPDATAPDDDPEPSLAEQYAALRAEYDAKMEAMREVQRGVDDQDELIRIYEELSPSLTDYARRMVDLAETDPTSEAARDALLWVIDQPSVSDGGTYGDQFARASALLVRHHSHDPDAVRIGLRLSNLLSFRRDALLLGLVASAEGREAEGLARMALAQYLRLKVDAAEGARKTEDRANVHILGRGEDGRTTSRVVKQSDEDFAYSLHLRQCDPEFLRAEVERLFEEVLADSADVPYHSRRSKTLGSVAAEQLDEIRNVSPGKVAPEIAGETLDGNPMALSDHRGKVVLLVFWGSWGRPEEVTHLVADLGGLPDRFEGRPFAMLGVNCDPNPEDAAHAIETGPIPWPNWYDPAAEDGPLARRYHVDRFPTLFLIDADGLLRHRGRTSYPETLAQAIEALLEKVEAGDDDNS